MKEKDALFLLFERDFGNGSLFKNQIELVNELIETPNTAYNVIDQTEGEIKNQKTRLKTYVSQLLSAYTKRNVTPDFTRSLRMILNKKIDGSLFDTEQILNEIIEGLKERNRNAEIKNSNSISNKLQGNDFYSNAIDSRYLTIFTSREIRFDFEILQTKLSFVNFLLGELIGSIKDGKNAKLYRFNFPTKQTCTLFWRACRKEIIKYLQNEKELTSSLIPKLTKSFTTIIDNKIHDGKIESIAASLLLHRFSEERIICVFNIDMPVFTIPLIALNPNDSVKANTYLLLQNENGNEQIHKMTKDEFFHWKLFVWDSLRSKNSGEMVKYSDSY